jgi:hypothetical protein
MPIRSIRDGTLTIQSVDATPKTKVVDFVEGGLAWTERRNPAVIHRDRMQLSHARKGNEEGLEGSFSFRYQDDDIRDTLVNLDFAGVAGASSEAQTVYAGWVNPETDAVVLAGATMFGRTLNAGDVIGGSRATTDVNGVNLLFTITDPAGGASENILFMAVHILEVGFEEGDEFNQMTVSFESAVKQPHTY